MNRIKRVTAAALALLILSGCGGGSLLPRMTEISDFEVARVFGIDANEDGVEITLVADRSTQGGDGEGGGKITEILSFSGETVAAAISKMTIHSDKRQHMGYVDFLLVGEAAARDGITKYLDYFTRDFESRYSSKIYIIRGDSAKDFLKKTTSAERSIDASLNNINELMVELSVTKVMRIIDLVVALSIPYRATIIPALECTEIDFAEFVGGELPKKSFVPAGLAFLKDFKLVDYYDAELAPAYNDLSDREHATPISIKDDEGDSVSLTVRRERVNVETVWDGDTLKSVKYRFMLYASLTEQHGIRNLYSDETLAFIAGAVSDKAKDQLERVIEKSKEHGQDGFELASRVRFANPIKWASLNMEERWSEIFPTVDIEVEVDTQIRRTYDLREPIGYSKDEMPPQAADRAAEGESAEVTPDARNPAIGSKSSLMAGAVRWVG